MDNFKYRRALLASAACAAFTSLCGGASAQEQPAISRDNSVVEEVVVTGSRIQAGFQAPTPVTVASAEQLKQASPSNLAEALNQLPVFNGSSRTIVGTNTNAGGATGQNLLSLRGQGASRTLVLLNGRRMPATNASGSVDVNVIPQDLVKRVDIVTGGASAAYGSDAVAGVVNFVLDTKFEGFKGEVQAGISSRDDLPLGGASFSFGRSFGEGKGHVIGGLSYFYQEGIPVDEKTNRDWFDDSSGQIANPRSGVRPSNIIIPSIRSSIGTFGGLISSGPLKGTQFLAGSLPATFDYGVVTGSAFQSGGDGAPSYIALAPDQLRYSGFVHGEYDLSDSVTVFGESLYARSHTRDESNYLQNVGSALQYTIARDNAFLPASTAQQMDAAKVTSFPLGRFETEFPLNVLESKIDTYRQVVGLSGEAAFRWRYDLSYAYGQTNLELRQNNLSKNRALYASADAVRDPTGKIVCRSTLQGLDPGCVPRNLFGPQSGDAAANAYILGDSVANLRLKQHVVAFNLAGDLGEKFKLADPISVAAGVEFRRETGRQVVDAISAGLSDLTGIRGFPAPANNKVGGWRTFNPQPFSGGYDIKEGYIEVGVPLLRDLPLAQSLDLNGAVRHADYSQSGGVNTWKVGGVWDLVDGVRFRSTYSQDIRGPNLIELFNPGSQTLNNLVYRGASTQSLNISSGNTDLRPERARTLTFGAVLQPIALPGFQLSVDYYRIRVQDAIGQLGPQRILDECGAGNQSACGLFTVTSVGTLIVRDKGLNLSQQRVAGVDLEAAYRRDVLDGQLTVRAIGNRALVNDSQSPGAARRENLGSTAMPKWRGVLQATYQRGDWSFFLQERYMGKAKLDPNRVEGVDIGAGDNSTPAIGYTDLTVTRRIHGGRHEVYFSISNLFDQDPPLSPPPVTSFSFAASNAYDQVGRYFTTGIRFGF